MSRLGPPTAAALAASLALVLGAAPLPAAGQPTEDPGFEDGDNSFGGNNGGGDPGDDDQGGGTGGGGHEGDGDGGSTTSPWPHEERVLVDDTLGGPGCPDGQTRRGTWEVRLVTGPEPDDWEHVRWEYDCWDGSAGSVVATSTPPGPSQQAVHTAIREYLPLPAGGFSPPAFGVTGLETWLWFEHDDPAALSPVDHDGDVATPPIAGMTATATEGGWTITATAWVDEYRWELADGTVLRSDHAGSVDDPAAAHTWRTMDRGNVVRVVARWTGTYRWTTPGSSGSGSMGSLDVATDHPYPVHEVRAVPDD